MAFANRPHEARISSPRCTSVSGWKRTDLALLWPTAVY